MLPSVSIIICTRNRAQHLEQTLASICTTRIPPLADLELIVVDNGSSDDTSAVVKGVQADFPVRLVTESTPGLTHARNAALAAARHDILLWVDDDVRVPNDWISPMIAPLAAGEASIVAGGVTIAPHLRRDWMEPWHCSLLAATAHRLDPTHPQDAVGANMAFLRSVTTDVPSFDRNLGAGRLGSCEESHFFERLIRAGHRIAPAFHVQVEHHFDAARLRHASFVSALEGLGRSQAYLQYHWRHTSVPFEESSFRTRLRLWALTVKYKLRRLLRGSPPDEGMPTWESYYVRHRAYLRQSLIERTRPRRYSKYGDRPLNDDSTPDASSPPSYAEQLPA